MKNTRIHSVLLWVLSSGIGVYLSPFRDVWGSRIIFAGPSKYFTQANKDQQRETIVHAVYSVRNNYLETNNIGEFRSEPISKVGISHHISRGVTMFTTDLLSPGNSAELARVTVSTDDREQLSTDNCRFRLDSGSKIDKFWDLLMICVLFIFIILVPVELRNSE